MIKITFDDKALNKQLAKALKAAPKEATKAVFECTQNLAEESAKRAPVEIGDLRSDCHGTVNGVTVFEKQKAVGAMPPPANIVIGKVEYGLPYAIRQHEDLTLRHDRADGYRVPPLNKRTGEPNKTAGKSINRVAGGEAKFLENPFNERKDQYIQRFRKVVEDSIK